MNQNYSNKYKNLFFDIDHTLWDFEKNSFITLQEVYQRLNLHSFGIESFEVFEPVYYEINNKMWDRFRKGFLSREDLRWKRMWQSLLYFGIYNTQLAKDMSELYLEILPTQKNLFPYTIETLDYCRKKGYRMHLITNGFEKTQIQKLQNAQIFDYFEVLITSEMAMSMKPHKEIFNYALYQSKADVESSLMIGDALDIDILGARQIGMAQMFFNPNKISHQEKPTYEIECLSEIQSIL